ncbi:MAG: CsbD family protein [Actinomycetota bacterium]|nr:CsbD family protein [Actinomycetota bacterium]
MTRNIDTAKGKVKQAIADLTGNDDLHREGERDELAGKAKNAIDTARDALKSPK